MFRISLSALLVLLASQILVSEAQTCTNFPAVDLGYAIHVPTMINTTAGNLTYATYANIRFAQPPVGELRFRRPQLPLTFNASVQDGKVPRNSTNCLNAIPPGVAIAPGVDGTSWGSEDCLFLDVKVPNSLRDAGLPVLVWFFGGGYFFGSKEPWAGSPEALFQNLPEGKEFIAVSINYRIGMLGWLAPDVEGFDKNVGLYDALAGLEWVRDYISYFGGDPNQITIIGESAGGGIGQHLVTAYGGEKQLPIQKAILTSPGFRPHLNRQPELNYQYELLLNTTNCADLACLRSLPTGAIAEANKELIFNFNLSTGWIGPGVGIGGPVVDGDLVPDIPWRLLQSGRYQKGVEGLIAGNPVNDGVYATVFSASNWEDQLKFFMRTPTRDTISKISALYSQNLTDAFNQVAGDIVFKCHSYFLASAFGKSSYKYYMSIPPATHGQDQFYYFHQANTPASTVEFPEIASNLQEYFQSFILRGDPGGRSGLCQGTRPHWPTFGSSGRWMDISSDGFQLQLNDTGEAERCETILSTMNDPDNGW